MLMGYFEIWINEIEILHTFYFYGIEYHTQYKNHKIVTIDSEISTFTKTQFQYPSDDEFRSVLSEQSKTLP